MEWGGQNYTSTGINSDFKYNILQSTSIQGKFIFSDISYTSKEGAPSVTSPVSYTILEGLPPGRNYVWGLDFTKQLGSSLEISLQYDGRKPAGQGVINTGRAALAGHTVKIGQLPATNAKAGICDPGFCVYIYHRDELAENDRPSSGSGCLHRS